MNEEHVPQGLLPFHLGALEEAEREHLEAHLLGCRACLAEYLALKRRFDSASAFEDRPSPAARERLRTEVRRRLPRALTRPRVWAVGAALAAARVALLWLGTHRRGAPSASPETLIDTGPELAVHQVL